MTAPPARPALPGREVADPLSALLRRADILRQGNVSDVRAEPAGESGRFGQVFRLYPTYSSGAEGTLPATIILKRHAVARAERQYADSHGYHAAEIAFYRHAAGASGGLRLPFFLGTLDDPVNGSGLVLEDLGATHRQISWADGLGAAEAAAAVDWMARLHRVWQGRTGQLPKPLRRCLPQVPRLAIATFLARARSCLADPDVKLCQLAYARLAELRLAAAAEPETLCHGDLHTMNLFFPEQPDVDMVTAVDWQLCGRGTGLLDLAGFMCFAMSPRLRKRLEADLLARYLATAADQHGELAAATVDSYRLALALCLAEPAGMLDRGHELSFAVMCLEKILLACRAFDITAGWIRSVTDLPLSHA